jgi:hypothetical protein
MARCARRRIAANSRYISKYGRLDLENERGESMRGKDALPELVDDWRFGGTLIEDFIGKREAFNIMLSMPRGAAQLPGAVVRCRLNQLREHSKPSPSAAGRIATCEPQHAPAQARYPQTYRTFHHELQLQKKIQVRTEYRG